MPIIRKTPGSIIKIGNNVSILSSFDSNSVGINRPSMLATLRPGASIKIGKYSGLSGTVISAAKSISIGENVLIGANCTLVDNDSHVVNYKNRYVKNSKKYIENDAEINIGQIIINDYVFIGMNSIILKGVEIGKGSVVASGSVVTKSFPENVVIAGNPARIVKYLE